MGRLSGKGALITGAARGQGAAAARRFAEAAELDPDNSVYWVSQVRALRAAGDPGAEAALHRADLRIAASFGRVIVVGLRPQRDHGSMEMRWTIPSRLTPMPPVLQRKAAQRVAPRPHRHARIAGRRRGQLL